MKRSTSSKTLIGEYIEKLRRRRKRGHFAVYSKEGKRFMVPLCFLNHPIFKVLLEMAEEEFGLTVRGPIRVPCEEELMDYILSLLRNNPDYDHQLGGDTDRAFVSLNTTCAAAASLSSLLFLAYNFNQGARATAL